MLNKIFVFIRLTKKQKKKILVDNFLALKKVFQVSGISFIVKEEN
jgi:hypothetical protein